MRKLDDLRRKAERRARRTPATTMTAREAKLAETLKDIAWRADCGRLSYDDHELRPLLEELRDIANRALDEMGKMHLPEARVAQT